MTFLLACVFVAMTVWEKRVGGSLFAVDRGEERYISTRENSRAFTVRRHYFLGMACRAFEQYVSFIQLEVVFLKMSTSQK